MSSRLRHSHSYLILAAVKRDTVIRVMRNQLFSSATFRCYLPPLVYPHQRRQIFRSQRFTEKFPIDSETS